MIYVSKHQLKQVEYLIHQSIQGNHPLFDESMLRDVFGDGSSSDLAPPPMSESDAYAVEPELERMILQPTLGEKRSYLLSLDNETRRRLVRTYFNIIENNIFETLVARH